MINYFIHYTFTNNGKDGVGNCDIKRKTPISDIGAIRQTEKVMKMKWGYDSLLIKNFQRFEDS